MTTVIDWSTVLNTLIGSLPLIITAVTGLIKIMQVEKNTNSMKDALVAAVKADALQTGRQEGKLEERAKALAKSEAHAAGVADEKARIN